MSRKTDQTTAVYIISVAAELAGMHPQTLRVYEQKGLVQPSRTQGGSRRYSEQDVEMLRQIQVLSSQGISLEGIKRIVELEEELERTRQQFEELRQQMLKRIADAQKQSRAGELVPFSSQAVAIFRSKN